MTNTKDLTEREERISKEFIKVINNIIKETNEYKQGRIDERKDLFIKLKEEIIEEYNSTEEDFEKSKMKKIIDKLSGESNE